MTLPEFFKDSELSCRCGCGAMPPAESVYRLYALRVLYGKPMTVTSAARCLKHNKAVGGAAGSVHLPTKDRAGAPAQWGGGAFDIKTSSLQEAGEIERLALLCGFRGVGRAGTFVHIDDAARQTLTYWRY
jgi:hypothetical protein